MITELKENKLVLAIVGLLLASLLGWGTWVTVELFAQDKGMAMAEKDKQSISGSIGEVKKEIVDIKSAIAKSAEKINDNQEEILKILLDIKREAKRR
jgi:hypothetical protein